MVLGSPGKIIKTFDDDMAAIFKASADHYIANAKRFAEGLREI